MSSDVIGATQLFYTPFGDDTVPLFDGTARQHVQFAEMSLKARTSGVSAFWQEQNMCLSAEYSG
jgi:hypothetical protein